MKSQFKLSVVTLSLAVGLVAAALCGCSSNLGTAPAPTYGCAAKGPCENDPTPSTEEASSCQSLQDDKICGGTFTAYSMCAYAAAKCTDGGMSDPTLDSTSSECNSEYAAYTTCLQNKINDGGV